jgi:hypothetical protein
MSLTHQDLVTLEEIIRIGQSRGAFKPEEMVPVGNVYGKLVEIIKMMQAQSATGARGPQGPSSSMPGPSYPASLPTVPEQKHK